ncbi:hypothetical protein D3C85_1858390 [compost metagenome]
MCYGQRKVSCSSAFSELACQTEADNIRHNEVQRLTQHASLSLDTAYAPAYYAKTVNHRCMGVRTYQ